VEPREIAAEHAVFTQRPRELAARLTGQATCRIPISDRARCSATAAAFPVFRLHRRQWPPARADGAITSVALESSNQQQLNPDADDESPFSTDG
jgi:hypothetical protein